MANMTQGQGGTSGDHLVPCFDCGLRILSDEEYRIVTRARRTDAVVHVQCPKEQKTQKPNHGSWS